ncbi:hypothetical protein HYW75_07115 [Candidatus Pacearchaeota archaeon]|nr:hypothetical protein [Candidatus Pacearchaeota archaeon]
MGFGEVFGKSWKEYKDNFWSIFIFMSIFILIPSLFVLVVNFSLIGNYPSLQNINLNPIVKSTEVLGKTEIYYYILMGLLTLTTIFLPMVASAGILKNSLIKERYTFRELKKEGIVSLGRFLLISIVILFFLLCLFLLGMLFLFILPGLVSIVLLFLLLVIAVIFIVYWIFGPYVLFDEKKGVFKSLRKSMEIVKGRWWKTLGYTIVLILIMIGISIASSLISLPGILVYMIYIFGGKPVSSGIFIFLSLSDAIANFVGSLLIVPLSTLFFKNLYLKVKKNKKY